VDASLLAISEGGFSYTEEGVERVASFESLEDPPWTVITSESLDEFVAPFARSGSFNLLIVLLVTATILVASILLASVGGGGSRRILTVDGSLDVLAWSPDGRWLAGTNWPTDGSGAKTMLVRVSEGGDVDGEPRFLGPGAGSGWGHQWRPDSGGFLSAGTDGDVWLLDLGDALVGGLSR